MGTVITTVKTASSQLQNQLTHSEPKVATSAWSFACAHPIIVGAAIFVCVGLVVYQYCSKTEKVTTASVLSPVTAI